MASRDKDLDDDEEVVKPPKNNKKGLIKWALIVLGVVLLIALSVGTSIYFMKSMISAPENITAEKGGDVKSKAKAKEEDKKHKEPKVAIYYKFDPPFVANIQGQSGSRFLQLTIEAMTYDQAITTELDQNMPVIRNNILLLLSDLTYEKVATMEGKQKI